MAKPDSKCISPCTSSLISMSNNNHQNWFEPSYTCLHFATFIMLHTSANTINPLFWAPKFRLSPADNYHSMKAWLMKRCTKTEFAAQQFSTASVGRWALIWQRVNSSEADFFWLETGTHCTIWHSWQFLSVIDAGSNHSLPETVAFLMLRASRRCLLTELSHSSYRSETGERCCKYFVFEQGQMLDILVH